jgi:hypothetical protein
VKPLIENLLKRAEHLKMLMLMLSVREQLKEELHKLVRLVQEITFLK